MHIQIKTMACRWVGTSDTCTVLDISDHHMLQDMFQNSDIALQRRCYWLLDGDDGTVLVHYLASKKLGRANSDPRCQSEPMLSHFWDTARADDYERLPYSNKAQRTYQGGLQDTCMNFEQVPSLWGSGLLCTSCLHAPCTETLRRSRHGSNMLENRYCSLTPGLRPLYEQELDFGKALLLR